MMQSAHLVDFWGNLPANTELDRVNELWFYYVFLEFHTFWSCSPSDCIWKFFDILLGKLQLRYCYLSTYPTQSLTFYIGTWLDIIPSNCWNKIIFIKDSIPIRSENLKSSRKRKLQNLCRSYTFSRVWKFCFITEESWAISTQKCSENLLCTK